MIDFSQTYPLPKSFKRQDGSNRFAFITFVMRNDSFIPGALLFAYSLRQQFTQADLVCLVTREVSSTARLALEVLFDRVVEVGEIFIPHKRRQERQDRPFLFTRFQALRSGSDGDLGLNYEKIVLVDADVLPLQFYDHLFTLSSPAGIVNESKSFCMEYNSDGVYVIPPSVAVDGTWNWHSIYRSHCSHGERIPREITDRVLMDPANMGVNSALWVLTPSMDELEYIQTAASSPEMNERIGDAFNWPEMQFASLHWSGQWTSIDLRFCSFNGYPNLGVLCGTHFAGYKPWNFKNQGTILRFSRFPDYSLWHRLFLQMVETYPVLIKTPKLSWLKMQINFLQSQLNS